MTQQEKDGCIGFIVAIVLGLIGFGIMHSMGYHQVWSWTNGKFIWVDKEGKG